jgi:preprotein translocase subunit SecA
MNKQRESVYGLRRELLEDRVHIDHEEEESGGDILDVRAYLMMLAEGQIDTLVESYCGEKIEPEDWDTATLELSFGETFGFNPDQLALIDLNQKAVGEIEEILWSAARKIYTEKETAIDDQVLRRVERDVMLQVVDVQWKDHLYGLDHLKEGINLRGYGQRDPLVEYKRESFGMFQAMKERIDEETVKYLWRLRPVVREGETASTQPQLRRTTTLSYNEPRATAPTFAGIGGAVGAGGKTPRPTRTGGDDALVQTVRRDLVKVGRNDPCPCGSGKKYKKCHGT